MTNGLERWADERGYHVAWGPVEAVAEARREVLARVAAGELHAGFFREELEPLVGEVPLQGGTAVAVAKPVPAHLVHFLVDGGTIDGLLPPTYVRYRATFEEVRRDLAGHGLPGARVEHIGWPVKAVAARLGLVRYGRNNVTYTPGLGSYVQICCFLTDAALPTTDRTVHAPALLDECTSCGICASACPTGAIDGERVLLHAERCLTCLNENTGAWPSWLPAAAHHCLLGCLYCQQACPVNGPLEVVDTGLEFSEEESRSLLVAGEGGSGRAETGIRFKLAWLGQPYAEPVLGRNLRALLNARRRITRS